jgi:hypothetical protein
MRVKAYQQTLEANHWTVQTIRRLEPTCEPHLPESLSSLFRMIAEPQTKAICISYILCKKQVRIADEQPAKFLKACIINDQFPTTATCPRR